MARNKFKGQSHPLVSHTHEHAHVTHYTNASQLGGVDHLLSVHEHLHNHAAMEHAHLPHRNEDKEHRREAHIHDHSHPNDS